MSLPTYEEVVKGPSIWSVVCPYVDLSDLYSAGLVNREFQAHFAPELWSDPIRVIAKKSRPFMRTVTFMNCARVARQDTRDLILHLDFRPLLPLRVPTILDYIQNEHTISANWVLRHTTFFKNLRFLVVDGLNMHDEINLDPRNPSGEREIIGPHVLLLSTSGVRAIDSTFIETSTFLMNVMYLDISYTNRSESWTRQMSAINFQNLRVLKLRGLRMTDQNIPMCVLKTGCRLWSLDLRDNLLTDQTLEALANSTFLLPITQAATPGPTNDDSFLYDSAPRYEAKQSRPQVIDTCTLRADDIDGFASHIKTFGNLKVYTHHPLVQEQEETPEDPFIQRTGLTQLYLAHNKFTSFGIRRLLRQANRLQVLDIGSVRSQPAHIFQIPYTIPYAQVDTGIYLHNQTGTRLTSLRIHHSVITQVPTNLPSNGVREYTLASLKLAETIFGPKQQQQWRPFSPLDNYRIESVTLTDIPTKSFGMIIDSLLTLLGQCAAQERQISTARSGPASHSRRSPVLLPGLRKLRLEFLGESRMLSPSASKGTAASVSISGDRDADVFLAAGMGDFSFFGGGGDAGGGSTGIGGKEMSRESSSSSSSSVAAYGNVRDVVEELKVWRRTEDGKCWTGKLELVRPK